jgi:ribosome biogenesis protein ERB1
MEQLREFSESDSEYEEYEEKRFKVFRKQQLPDIEPVYDSDSSEEEFHNTVGNVPMTWYDDFPHIGYDIHGKKIMKPAQGDELDKFLKSLDDKNAWRSVYDRLDGKDIVLNKEELEMLKRIQQHQFPDSAFDPYEPAVDWFSSKTEIMPLSGAPEPKRRFIPSKMEASRIMKIAKAIRAGFIVPGRKLKANEEKPVVYDIWAATEDIQCRPDQIQAPKIALPEHIESYNPPAEYLLSPEEELEWKEMDSEDRPFNFLPKKFDALRKVGAYPRFIHERFERCLDLYLCPRTIKQKLNIDPESLIPKLPSPKELKPYPSKLMVTFSGHTNRVRTLCSDPSGQWIASGSDDCTVRIWEISTGRNFRTFSFENPIMCISWNPNKSVTILAVCSGEKVVLLDPGVGNTDQKETTSGLIAESRTQFGEEGPWELPAPHHVNDGHLLHLQLKKRITHFVWHRKGDYFATITPDGK